MAKRFTDCEKWRDPWFMDLSLAGKVLFMYLCDNCDMAGFYERHDRMALFSTHILNENLDVVYNELSKSVLVRGRWVFVKNFARHQKNLPLNPENNAHQAIIKSLILKGDIFGDLYLEIFDFSLEELRALLGASQGLVSPIGKGKGKGNKGGMGGFTKPNPEDLKALFREKGFPAEADKFFDYYESNGWRVGKNPMKNWRSAAANWLRNGKSFGGSVVVAVKKELVFKRDTSCTCCHGTGFMEKLPGVKCQWCWK